MRTLRYRGVGIVEYPSRPRKDVLAVRVLLLLPATGSLVGTLAVAAGQRLALLVLRVTTIRCRGGAHGLRHSFLT